MPERGGRRVLVVGGGIAGFALLRACLERGVAAELVERSDQPAESPLGLNLPGNAIWALRALGLADGLAALGRPVRRREYRNARDRLLFAVDEVAFWGEADGPRCVRRADLLRLLRDGLDPKTVRWGTAATDLRSTPDGVEVTLGGSEPERYDLVVGADGVHSRVRGAILPGSGSQSALLSAASWRFVTADPGVAGWSVWSGPAGSLLLIPVDEGQVYGYASATTGGAVADDPEWLRATFGSYPPPARRAVASALADPATLFWSPVEEVRLPVWHRDRMVLIGDAAHATAPVWAQGAALAVEDAVVLADLLASANDWTRVGPELERRRRPRVDHVQAMTDRLSRTAALPGWFRDAILPVVGPRTYRATFSPLRQPVLPTSP